MNRWVGIVALRETAPPTPVHRIALAIEAARKRTSYRLAEQQVPYARMRAALRVLGQGHARRHEWDRYTYCVELAGDFFDGGEPPAGLPFWLTAELQNLLKRSNTLSKPAPRKKAKEEARRKSFRTQQARRTDGRDPLSSHRGRRTPANPTRSAAARTVQRPSPEPVRPYVRVARQLAVGDVTYPALSLPPAALVAGAGGAVRAAVRDAVGEWDVGPEATAWLGLASSHRSHLYESGLATTTVTDHVLGMLDRLGRSTLAVVLLDAYTEQSQPEKVGTQSSEHNRRLGLATRAIGQWLAEHGLVRMGAGEAQRPAPSVAESVARQLLGAISLVGTHETARRLVEAVCTGLDQPADDTSGTDPVTEAHMLFGKEDLAYDFTEQGPEHSKTFVATARTRTGRTARGTGQSKKAARAAAARALLRDHLQAAGTYAAGPAKTVATGHTGPDTPPQPYRAAHAGHRDAVADLVTMFELGGRQGADGLLAQALTHSSFVYENRAAATAAHQRDNQLLAHHGSVILDHLAAHAKTQRVLAHGLVPDEDEARVHYTSNEDTARLATDLSLADGVLTGRGESTERPTVVADAAQAVIATAWRVHGPRLLYRRPAALDDWLSGLEHQHHPVTVLNYMASTFGMTYSFEHQRTGPDHLQTHTATLVLRDAHGRVHRWTAHPDGPCSKGDADRLTAEEVLDILAAPVEDIVDDLTEDERRLLTFFLRAELDGLGTPSERQRARIVSNGDLGTDLLATGDLDAFLAWTNRVEPLLGSNDTAVPDTLRELYGKVIADTRLGPRSVLRRMEAHQGTDGASVVQRHAAEAVNRAARTGAWGVSVRDIVQGWWRDQAPRTAVTVRDDMRQEVVHPLPVHLSALDETLTWCGEAAEAADARIDVELTIQDGTLHVWLGLDKVDARAACDDFARLLSRTLPHTDCVVAEDHLLLRLHGSPDTEGLSPIATAGLDAYLSMAGAARSADE
jgi:dsRNA-specific ribonuclease